MAQTANWQVKDDRMRRTVAGPTSGRIARWNCAPVSGFSGGHRAVLARTAKYAANSPAKNITSEVKNRSIPRTTLLMPPVLSWLRPATGLTSVVVRAWLSDVIGSVLDLCGGAV